MIFGKKEKLLTMELLQKNNIIFNYNAEPKKEVIKKDGNM